MKSSEGGSPVEYGRPTTAVSISPPPYYPCARAHPIAQRGRHRGCDQDTRCRRRSRGRCRGRLGKQEGRRRRPGIRVRRSGPQQEPLPAPAIRWSHPVRAASGGPRGPQSALRNRGEAGRSGRLNSNVLWARPHPRRPRRVRQGHHRHRLARGPGRRPGRLEEGGLHAEGTRGLSRPLRIARGPLQHRDQARSLCR